MERLFNRFTEIRKQWRPGYVNDLEAQAGRFMSGLTYGGKGEKLLDAGDRGLIMYHYGPEIRVLPGFPLATEIPTGREYVFLEYHHTKGSYHFIGSVDTSKQFTLLKLERYKDGNGGYHRVLMLKHQEVIRSVLEILRGIELPHSEVR